MQDAASSQSSPEKTTALGRLRRAFGKYKTAIGLTLLVVYLLLLGLGTIGEVWKIEWILDLPLFRPPGKY